MIRIAGQRPRFTYYAGVLAQTNTQEYTINHNFGQLIKEVRVQFEYISGSQVGKKRAVESIWEESGSTYRGWYLDENNPAYNLNTTVVAIYTDVWSGSGLRDITIELFPD